MGSLVELDWPAFCGEVACGLLEDVRKSWKTIRTQMKVAIETIPMTTARLRWSFRNLSSFCVKVGAIAGAAATVRWVWTRVVSLE